MEEEEIESSDWMAASINSLIESANEAVMRGISKENILASIQDVQDKENGTTKDNEQVTSAIHNCIRENLKLSHLMTCPTNTLKMRHFNLWSQKYQKI